MDYGVQGGQGHEPNDVVTAATWMGLALLTAIAFVAASLFTGCMPTQHSHGNDEELHGNKPSPRELRHLNTF